MEKSDLILQDRLAAIQDEFKQDLADRITAAKELWRQARFTPGDSVEFQRLQKLVRQLESHSTPLNLFLLADRAHKLDVFLTFLYSEKKPLSETHRQQLDLLLQSLATAAATCNDDSASEPRAWRWEPATIRPEFHNHHPLIYLLDTHRLWAEQLLEHMRPRFRPQIFFSYQSYAQAVAIQPPTLVITDTPLRDTHHRPGIETRQTPANLSSIFIAREDTLEARLLAVRSGAAEFYTLPLAVSKVADKARELITGLPKDPYRLMIVDNDEPLARFYAMVLGQEGMNVTIVTNPLKTLAMLAESRPELILISTAMPLLSGLELARVIRQEEHFAGIAIVFLSVDAPDGKRLAAITAGGDDVLNIPVEPDALVTTVNARVTRARTLNSINRHLYSALRELENQQFALNQHAIVSITNVNGVIIYVNDKLCEISGYTRAELIGKDHVMLNSGFHDRAFFQTLWLTVSQGKVWQGEVCNRKKNGEVFWVDMTIVPFFDEQSRPYQYVAINSDISAKKFIERDLLEARDLAINANQAKSDFLSKMSHELRTPLNAVLGFSQLLASSRDQPLTEAQAQYIFEIHNAGNHLLKLINDVLDLSRIEANQLLMESVNIPLVPFLDECVALILPTVKQKHIEICAPYRTLEDVFVLADPLRLKQVLANLLSNAVKYNQVSGTVKIAAHLEYPNEITIEVTDSGAGIDAEHIDKLFQPFTRLPQHRKEEGVGIGLALSKRLTEMMGGRIGVRSAPGAGTTFWISMPRAEGEITVAANPVLAAPATTPTAPAHTTPTTLLYIEDNDTNLLLVRELLAEHSNFQLLHSYTVKSGIETALAQHPDIILMDLDLPDTSGYEGIKILKSNPALAAIPVLAISAYADQESMQRAELLGFAEYIAKPMDINQFLARLEKYRSPK